MCADEADLLCDRVSIVTQGRMRCLGTQHHLKLKFGGGYSLQINYAPTDEAEADALALVQRSFPNAKRAACFRGYAAFTLALSADSTAQLSIADVFEVMNRCEGSVITDWCVGQVRLCGGGLCRCIQGDDAVAACTLYHAGVA